MSRHQLETVDVAIIGAGMAGMCAALFASQRNMSVALVGNSATFAYSSGLLDLLGVYPITEGKPIDDPWVAIREISVAEPNHPYALMPEDDIRTAFNTILDALISVDYPYANSSHQNSDIITSLGTSKKTYCFPTTMAAGIDAFRENAECLLVDFDGMKDYSAKLIAANTSSKWPSLRWTRLQFPNNCHLPEISCEYLARLLDIESYRTQLVELIAPHTGKAKYIGLPAILGFHKPSEAHRSIERALGARVFEIPSTPVSVPGIRLHAALEKLCKNNGVTIFSNRVNMACDSGECSIGADDVLVTSRKVILASGRTLGGGRTTKNTIAERHNLIEPLFNLPVFQPETRMDWHRDKLFDPRGHSITAAGIEIDEHFRPRNTNSGNPHADIHVAGSILAHQNWTRMKCGSGLAIATAWAAVKHCYDSIAEGK
ncbi:MAG: glycerol-3-phosphate dehydrogenase subunit GlpB [Polyangiaceae bacterium]|nr:glycerol-3-phosphate dehydrogenase subunit GlpB [Polyangiaceae bacterium]